MLSRGVSMVFVGVFLACYHALAQPDVFSKSTNGEAANEPKSPILDAFAEMYVEASCIFFAVASAWVLDLGLKRRRPDNAWRRGKKLQPEAEASENNVSVAPRDRIRSTAERAGSKALAQAVRDSPIDKLPKYFDQVESLINSGVDEAGAVEHVVNCVRSCVAKRAYNEALGLYDRVATRLGDGSKSMWSLLLYCAVEAKDQRLSYDFVPRVLQLPPISDNDFVNMVRTFTAGQNKAGLDELFRSLSGAGYKPDIVARNRALCCCVNNQSPELVEVVVEHTKDVPMDGICYNTLMKSYKLLKDCECCCKLLVHMREGGVLPSGLTFGIVLDACVECNNVEACLRVFDELKSSGIQLNVVHYTTVMKGLLGAGRLDDAMLILTEMQLNRCQADLVAYSTLVKALSDHGKVDEAIKLISQMRDNGVPPDLVLFNIVLGGCCAAGFETQDAGRVLQVLDRLLELGLSPATSTLSVVVKALTQSCAWREAFLMLQRAPQRFGIKPQPRLYAQVVHASYRACRWREARDEAVALGLSWDQISQAHCGGQWQSNQAW